MFKCNGTAQEVEAEVKVEVEVARVHRLRSLPQKVETSSFLQSCILSILHPSIHPPSRRSTSTTGSQHTTHHSNHDDQPTPPPQRTMRPQNNLQDHMRRRTPHNNTNKKLLLGAAFPTHKPRHALPSTPRRNAHALCHRNRRRRLAHL